MNEKLQQRDLQRYSVAFEAIAITLACLLSLTAPRHGVPPPAFRAELRLRRPDRFALLALAILVLTALNLTYRLNRETITEWDESLYATSAWEMLQSGDWISTTFHGEIDYYNAKPPLNVWLIALAFKVFGVSTASLRLASVVCAWLTVAILMWWTRRIFGDMHALLAGLVLATCFGFIYVHSARTANTDALFTLLMLLVVITLDASEHRPWRRVWLGPILAAVFLLRGTAVLMPLALIAAVASRPARPRGPRSWLPSVCAALMFAAPVLAWGVARWRVDQWRFFDKLWSYDLIARTAFALEGHGGTPLFYLDVLQKYQYDWLVAAAVAIALRPPSIATVINGLSFWRSTTLPPRAHWLVGRRHAADSDGDDDEDVVVSRSVLSGICHRRGGGDHARVARRRDGAALAQDGDDCGGCRRLRDC